MPSTTLNLGRVKGSMWYTGTADSNVDIASALTSAGYTPIKLDMYLNTSNGNVYQYAPVDDGLQWTLKGNLRGAKGEGFQIKKTYASVSAMNAGYATDGLPVGSFVMISSNVDDPDNAKLYVKGETAYTFVTDFSGAQGIQGEKGDKGDTGAAGADGADGADALVYYGETIRITDPLSINQIMNFDKSKFNREPVFGEYFVAIIKFFESFDNYSSGIYKTYLGYYEVNNANGVDSDGETIIVFAVLRTFVETTGTTGATGADGAAGADGQDGAAATVEVGTVTTGAAGTQAQVVNVGTSTNAILNFTIPKGDTGAAGADGADGEDALMTNYVGDGELSTSQTFFIADSKNNRPCKVGDNVIICWYKRDTENGGYYSYLVAAKCVERQSDGGYFLAIMWAPSRGATGATGADGVTPEIGENGNWWINGEDTGKPSRGEVGQDGAQGRGYYRTEAILSTATASIERSRINPANGKLLVSDTIVDKNGLVFAVTKECDVGDETVYIAYRTSIKGADGLGVPAGGTTGQILAKKTKTDYDAEWIDAPSGGGSTMYAHHLRISDYGFATGTEQVNIAATIINTSANAITFDTLKAYLETLDNGYSKRLMVSGCAHDGTGVTAIVYGLMLSSNNIIAIYNAMTSTQVEQSVQLNNSAMVDDTVVQIC